MIAIVPSNPAAAAAAANTPAFVEKKALNTCFFKQVSRKAACSAGTNDGDFSGEWIHGVWYSNTTQKNNPDQVFIVQDSFLGWARGKVKV